MLQPSATSLLLGKLKISGRLSAMSSLLRKLKISWRPSATSSQFRKLNISRQPSATSSSTRDLKMSRRWSATSTLLQELKISRRPSAMSYSTPDLKMSQGLVPYHLPSQIKYFTVTRALHHWQISRGCEVKFSQWPLPHQCSLRRSKLVNLDKLTRVYLSWVYYACLSHQGALPGASCSRALHCLPHSPSNRHCGQPLKP